jgi:hypothetical protein
MADRPNPRDLLRNFHDYDAPLPVKLRLMLANNWKKLRTGSSCCDNHGEPGC